MDWSIKSWEKEDAAFSPKRKVGNKGSKYRPHIIGSFFSPKMNQVVEYESLNEYLFYSLLELDSQIIRYYVQPVQITIPYFDKNNRPSNWLHVPDVLVFHQKFEPHLYQVKDLTFEPSEKDDRVNFYCSKYASEKGWLYNVVYPKSIPYEVAQNAKFLMGFLQPRIEFETLIPELISRLKFLQITTIEELSKGFQGKAHPLQILPIIYHLIAKNIFVTNIKEKISEYSEIKVVSGKNNEPNFLSWREERDSQSTKGKF